MSTRGPTGQAILRGGEEEPDLGLTPGRVATEGSVGLFTSIVIWDAVSTERCAPSGPFPRAAVLRVGGHLTPRHASPPLRAANRPRRATDAPRWWGVSFSPVACCGRRYRQCQVVVNVGNPPTPLRYWARAAMPVSYLGSSRRHFVGMEPQGLRARVEPCD